MDLKSIFLEIINKIETYSGIIGIFIVLIAGLWSFFKFKEYLKDRRFGIYHKLIKELVEPEAPDRPLKLDRQIAIVYELRNFHEYYEVSKRILRGLLETWEDSGDPRIIEEINISIEYMESNRFIRFFRKFRK